MSYGGRPKWLIENIPQDFYPSPASSYRTTKKPRNSAIAGNLRTYFVVLVSLILIAGTFMPATTRASLFGGIVATIKGNKGGELHSAASGNVQTMALLRPAMNISPTPARGGGEITIVDNSALVPEEGPSGTMADIEKAKNSTISIYVVREGDTISGIAQMFGVSANTIRWANDIPVRDTIRVGQTLTILPVTGVKYIVKKNDTLASIAKNFSGDAQEIASFNGLSDESALAVGLQIIIPDGEVKVAVAPRSTSVSGGGSVNSSISAGYYMRPLSGGVRTQGIHGYNGVDLAAPIGTPILASADGDVIVARNSGWNGGYGAYVVIRHSNGSQTLYAHASSVVVSVGQSVAKGEVIAYVGLTGKTTGPHVHFEIRNGPRNPF